LVFGFRERPYSRATNARHWRVELLKGNNEVRNIPEPWKRPRWHVTNLLKKNSRRKRGSNWILEEETSAIQSVNLTCYTKESERLNADDRWEKNNSPESLRDLLVWKTVRPDGNPGGKKEKSGREPACGLNRRIGTNLTKAVNKKKMNQKTTNRGIKGGEYVVPGSDA